MTGSLTGNSRRKRCTRPFWAIGALVAVTWMAGSSVGGEAAALHGRVAGPMGVSNEQFRLEGWDRPTTVDLTESVFYANEQGPFDAAALPRQWPSPEALAAMQELPNEEKYPVTLRGGPAAVHVYGGRVLGVQPRELPWRVIKALYDGDGIRVETAGPMLVEGMEIENVEDAVSPRGGGRWTVRGVHARYIRDDFVENDGLLSGEIDDCLVEGAHVFLSARPGKQARARGEDLKSPPPHVKISRTLVSLPMMPYDGDMQLDDQRYIVDGRSGGKLFKWSARGGTVELSDCIFRIDAIACTGPNSMAMPEGTYRNVTVIWLGEGEYPAPLSPGVTLSRDAALWENARAQWLADHAHGHAKSP